MSAELATTGGALAIRPDQTAWTPEQATVLQQSGIDDDVTAAELSGFLHLCQRTGLDPFSRQIYLIGRYDRRAGRKVFSPQTGIDGYRVVARRATAKSGGSYGYEDALWCDASGNWRDVWTAEEPPAAAKVTVLRDGLRFSAVALYQEYAQTGRDGEATGMWKKMPANQLAKCAEALALRKAFPHDLAGVYTAEEMAQADNGGPQLRQVQPGETDPWANPAPETAAQGRDYLHEAHEAADADAVRHIWLQARADGAVPEYLAQIADVGRSKAATEQEPPSVPDVDGVVDVETVPDGDDEHAAAVAELKAFAAEHGITDLDGAVYPHLGAPLDDVSAGAIRQLTQQLRASAA